MIKLSFTQARELVSQRGFLLGALIALGASLRLWGLGSESLRLDEAQSIWQASHTAEFIRTYMLKNVHLPLHNTLLHFWIRLFGSSEISVRFLSAIPGVLTIPAFYLLAREFLKGRWVLIATAFATISPFWIWYSREIRMYTLLTLVATLSYYFFVKILKRNKGTDYILYGLVNLIGIYTHYFFFLILFVQAIYFLIIWWSSRKLKSAKVDKKIILRRLIAVGLILFILFLPWLLMLVRSYGSGSLAPILQAPTTFNIALSFYEFSFGYQPDYVAASIIALWPLITLISFFFLMKREPIPRKIYFLILGILLPIAIVFFASLLIRPMYLTRYLIIVTPLFYIFTIWLLSELQGWGQKVLAGVLLILIVASLANQYVSPNNPAKEDYRAATTYISSATTPRDIVVLAPPYIVYPFQYYYNGPAQVTSIPIWDKRKGAIPLVTPERLLVDSDAIQANHQRLFLFVASDLEGGGTARDYFDKHLTKIEKRQFSKNLWLHVYQAEYLQPSPPPSSLPDTGYYTVKRGDSLSSISFRLYGNEERYSELAQLNKITNPNMILPDQKILLPH